jgi:hypothetical protein
MRLVKKIPQKKKEISEEPKKFEGRGDALFSWEEVKKRFVHLRGQTSP